MQSVLHFQLAKTIYQLGQLVKPIENLACLQVWLPAPHQGGLDALQKRLYTDPELVIMGSTALAPFRLSSCQSMQLGHQGMPGRVLRSGCVQVVQNLRIIPDVLHPRCRLAEAVADLVGEVVYVPVYDVHCPHAGPVAVLEALLSAHATDSMLVANFISVAGNVLSSMQLSLSNPLPQPVRRSKLEGRKPRPVHVDSSPELESAGYDGSPPPNPHTVVPSAAGAIAPAETARSSSPQHDACCSPAASSYVAPAAVAVAVTASASPQAQEAVACGSQCSPQHEQQQLDSPICGSDHHHQQQQQQHQRLLSCSSASANTVVSAFAAAGAASGATAGAMSTTECTLSSTLSSRPCDFDAGAAVMTAVVAAPGGADADAATQQGCMLPPRPHPAARQHHQQQQQNRRQRRTDDGGGAAWCSEGGDSVSPPPCKMRRVLSMVRTKSVPMGLDQVLAEAAAGYEPTASC